MESFDSFDNMETIAMRNAYLAVNKGVDPDSDFGELNEDEKIIWSIVTETIKSRLFADYINNQKEGSHKTEERSLEQALSRVVAARQSYQKAIGEPPCPDCFDDWEKKDRRLWAIVCNSWSAAFGAKATILTAKETATNHTPKY